jgi:PRTRC genetic system protein B
VNVSFYASTATSTLRLDSAILLYAADGTTASQNQEVLAMRHAIRSDASGIRLAEGVPITRSLLEGVDDLIGHNALAYIPDRVVAVGRNAVAWYEPAATRPMFFEPRSDAATHAFDRVPVPHPPLVFIAKNRSLSIFALARNRRPTLKTPLAPAPYWNVFDSGRVCLGSTRIPDHIDTSMTGAWTDAFFASNFTHLSSGKRWDFGGTYAELLAAAIARGSFDPAWLCAPMTTVERALCG